MNIPIKKLKNGFEIPTLGIGTRKMGGLSTRDKKNDDERDIEAIKYAIDIGFTCIDTAEMYAGGYSETLLGKALIGYKREKLFISSKVRGDNCSYNATKNACKNSLKRVGIDYFDLYYIHWRDEQFELTDTMKALCELVDEGYIKYIGVSNFSKETLAEAQKHSKYPIVANQVHYNLIYREPEASGLIEYCQKHDIMVVAWRPLEYGEFDISKNQDILQNVSKKYHKTPFQVALNWVISEPNIVTLFKSSTLVNIDENRGAVGWEMSLSDRIHLRENFPCIQTISNSVPLR